MNSEFKQGEVIEVSETKDFEKPYDRIFLTQSKGYFICVMYGDEANWKQGYRFQTMEWDYGRKKRPVLEIDQKVRVKNYNEPWFNGYFAGWTKDGRIQTYGHGRTSWTAINAKDVSYWDEYEIIE